jgi:serine/tyrosine/threonine adenylyltransferase
MSWNWNTTYLSLPEGMYSKVAPHAPVHPVLVLYNTVLAAELGLSVESTDTRRMAADLSGASVPEGATPYAMAYAGHQFGQFTMLGDGRAITLGEHLTPLGYRVDVQLKGGGQTPYSRRGDGKATLSSMLREYLISEAMHCLGIPTSRSLAVVATGERVIREFAHPGAVLTRIAASHLRVGTFEYARQWSTQDGLAQLTRYAIERHYPELLPVEGKVEAFLRAVMRQQIDLVVQWSRVGFIHGVMNTDNMSISGETIDYGPCAFMNSYDPAKVFSSIDRGGRYAFGNQAPITQWNLACLAGALLPLIHEDEDTAIAMAQDIISEFPAIYEAKHAQMLRAKIGLHIQQEEDDTLVQELLELMRSRSADYTNTFLYLMNVSGVRNEWSESEEMKKWKLRWQVRLASEEGGAEAALERMRSTNPIIIPRNHLVEAALEAAAFESDYSLYQSLLRVVRNPYHLQAGDEHYLLAPPKDAEVGYRTFCGT